MVRPAKGGRGKPPNYDPNNLPEFFKVFLPEYYSKEMLIPPKFVKDFLGRTPREVTLTNSEGKVWNVGLKKGENKLLMKKGWESFVIDNSLDRGEFLTFAYCGNAVFTVKIFSISGCKRNGTMATTELALVKVKQEPNMDEDYNHPTSVDETTCITREVKVQPESKDLVEVKTKAVPDKSIGPKRIRFTKVHSGQPYEMHIPAAVFSVNSIYRPKVKTSEMIHLRNQTGDSRKVRLLYTRDRRVLLTSGWNEFRKENKVVQGDECEFEVILGKQRKIKEILLLRIRRRKMASPQKAHQPLLTRKLRNR